MAGYSSAALAPVAPTPIDRLKNPILAFSKGLKKLATEPHIVTRIRLGLYTPKHTSFDYSMLDLAAKFQNNTEFNIGSLLPYKKEVVPAAAVLKEKYPNLTEDSLKTLILYTRQMPSFYAAVSNLMCMFGEGKDNSDIIPFEDFVFHFDTGIKQLANDFPSDGRLFCFAWLPQQTWDQFFDNRVGCDVVFKAPMSAADSPQWPLLDSPLCDVTGKVAVLFEFDETASKDAACLCIPGMEISACGNREADRTFSFFNRCRIGSIDKSMSSAAGTSYRKVFLNKLETAPPRKQCLVRSGLSTRNALVGAFFLSLHMATEEEAQSTWGDLIRQLLESLEHALTAREVKPEKSKRYVSHNFLRDIYLGVILGYTLNKAESDDGQSIFTGKAVFEKREAKSKEEIEEESELLGEEFRQAAAQVSLEAYSVDLESISIASIKEMFDSLADDPMSIFSHTKELMSSWAQGNDRIACWAKITSTCGFFAQLLDGDPGPANEFYETPPCFQAPEKPCDAMLRVGDKLWQADFESSDRGEWARRALGIEDVLRLLLSTCRLVIVIGRPDVGKTTFMEVVYGISTTGGAGLEEANRTNDITIYKEPQSDEEMCPTYLVDTPGFGDSVKERNDLVRLLAVSVSCVPQSTSAIWLHRAERHLQHVSDTLFQDLIVSLDLLVVVTMVDKLVEDRYNAMIDQLSKEKIIEFPDDEDEELDEDAEEILNKKRPALMKDIMKEVESNLQSLREEARVKHPESEPKNLKIVYACLANSSWACMEKKMPGQVRARKPQHWKTAAKDVQKFFSLKTVSELRRLSFCSVQYEF